ncbi:MAG: hypothetical protein KKE23_04240 [Nanoarchaeota archaeon]|nr:hypothetical protein [Nanoarchaeota archaeon]
MSHPEVILGGMSSSQGINYYRSPSGLWNKVMPEIRKDFDQDGNLKVSHHTEKLKNFWCA